MYKNYRMDTLFVQTFNKPFQALLEMEQLAATENILSFTDAEKTIYQFNLVEQTWTAQRLAAHTLAAHTLAAHTTSAHTLAAHTLASAKQ